MVDDTRETAPGKVAVEHNHRMDERDICREIISLFFSVIRTRISAGTRVEVCRKYRLWIVPKNSLLLCVALPERARDPPRLLLVKPTRTLSGVAPVAVMTSPSPCPHGKCLPCPGGPDHPFQSPQSYTGEEPAAPTGREHGYDPYHQVQPGSASSRPSATTSTRQS